MKRLTNQFFTYIRSIRIRRVDEVDAELDRTAQDCDGFRPISWLAPHAVACQLHRTEAQPVNAKIAADCERAAPCGRLLVSVYRRSWFSRSHVVLNSLDSPAHTCTSFFSFT
jgi:hypothetical protein